MSESKVSLGSSVQNRVLVPELKLNHPDIAQIKSSVGLVLSKAMASMQQHQPEDPIKYIGNYLLNHVTKERAEIQLEEDRAHRSRLQQKHQEENEAKKKQEQNNQLWLQAKEKIETEFEEKINLPVSSDYEELLVELASHLYNFTGATGVQIGEYKNEIRSAEHSESMNTNVEKENKIFRYLAANPDHKMMLDNCLNDGEGVTLKVFEYKTEEDEQPLMTNIDTYSEDDKTDPLQCLFIKEVVNEPLMKFQSVPRLGCFYAIPMIIKSVLFVNSLDEGANDQKECKEKENQNEELKSRYEEDVAERARSIEEGTLEENAEPLQEPEQEEIKRKEQSSKERKFIVCMDTLGQDRQFDEQQKSYARKTVRLFRDCWQEAEEDILSHDISFKLNQMEKCKDLETKWDQEFENAFEKTKEELLEEYGDNLSDEESDFIEMLAQAITIRYKLLNDYWQNELLEMKTLRVLKQHQIWQAAFYLLGQPKENIVHKDSLSGVPYFKNTLDWYQARHLVNEHFFSALEQYKIRGSKETKLPPYAKIQYLENELSEENIAAEDVEKYCYTQCQLLKLLRLIFKLRQKDAELRKQSYDQKTQQKQEYIKKKEDQNDRKKLAEEQGDEFEEEFEDKTPESPRSEVDQDLE